MLNSNYCLIMEIECLIPHLFQSYNFFLSDAAAPGAFLQIGNHIRSTIPPPPQSFTPISPGLTKIKTNLLTR